MAIYGLDGPLSPFMIEESLPAGEDLKRRHGEGDGTDNEVNKRLRRDSVIGFRENALEGKDGSNDVAVTDDRGNPKKTDTNGEAYDVEVLYKVRTIVKGKTDREFFSEKPFKGLSEENLLKVSVIEVTQDVLGEYKGDGKPSQTRSNWRKSVTIDFDEDFQIQTKRKNRLSIPSKLIRAALDRIIDYYPSQRATGSVHHEPYRALAHHYPILVAYYKSYATEGTADSRSHSLVGSSVDSTDHWADVQKISDKDQKAIDDSPCDEETASHLRTLLQFITPWYETNVVPEYKLYEQKPPMATFERLWLLFRPGDDVFVRSKINGELEGYVVLSTDYKQADPAMRTKREAHRRLRVIVWRFAYDGVQLFRTSKDIEIQEWDGEREMTSLDVFPVEFQHDEGNAKARLVTRGERFFDHIKEKHAFRTYRSPKSRTEDVQEIILDPQGYREFISSDPQIQASLDSADDDRLGHRHALSRGYRVQGGANPFDNPKELPDYGGESRFASYNNIDPRERVLTEHQCFLLPSEISGFELKRKTWSIFEVDQVELRDEVKENEAMENVLIDQNDFRILDTIPDRKVNFKTNTADFVSGKGEGRVFLFYGPPGTGKTITAECIAKKKHRPLLKVTNSDLGEIAMVERNLQKWFTLAERWGAIMLIDEADNFLQKRIDGAVKLNNLITVFLRSMEYFNGVIFLTTNIAANIDDAFLSRISVPIGFNWLEKNQCRKIWLNHFALHEKEGQIEVDERVKNWVRSESDPCELNGREIRNVLLNAVALAHGDSSCRKPVVVEKKHVDNALIRHQQFKKYIDRIKGGENEKQRSFLKVSVEDEDF